jgi:hypothetical protein
LCVEGSSVGCRPTQLIDTSYTPEFAPISVDIFGRAV